MSKIDKTTLYRHTADMWRGKSNLIAEEQGSLEFLEQEIINNINAGTQDFPLEINSSGDTIYRDSGYGFSVSLAVGSIIDTGTETRTVTEIIYNNSLGSLSDDMAKIDSPFSSDLGSNTVVTATTPLAIDIVNAINTILTMIQDKDRRILIKAIAMS